MNTNRRTLLSFLSGLFCGAGANSVMAKEAPLAGGLGVAAAPLKAVEAIPMESHVAKLSSLPAGVHSAILIEPGKTYALETDQFLSSTSFEEIKASWEATGAKCVILEGGLRVARPDQYHVTINAMDAQSFSEYLVKNSGAVAEAVNAAVHDGYDLSILNEV